MKWFYNMKISVKLISGFVLVAIIAAIVGYTGVTNLKAIDDSYSVAYEKMTVPISQLVDISTDFQKVRVMTRDIVLANTPEDIAMQEDQIKQMREKVGKISKEYEKLIVSPEMRELYDNFLSTREKYGKNLDQLTLLANQNRDEEAFALLNGEMKKSSEDEYNAIVKMVEKKVSDASKNSEENTAAANNAIRLVLIIIAAGVVLAVLIGIFISRIISKPIRELSEIADRLALGDVNVNVEVKTKDEIGQLTASFRNMVNNIKSQAAVAEQIAAGNLEAEVDVKSEADVLSKSLNLVVRALRELIDEANMLTKAAVEGRLDTRGNAVNFKGGYREIVSGVNKTLDAVIEPIKEASTVLKEMEKGNLTVAVNGDYSGDHAQIKNALNNLSDTLNQILKDINDAADQVAAGSKQVSDSSQALSQGSTEQASSVEEITASITQVAAQTKQNAVNAGQANELAESAKEYAVSGNNQMGEMLKAMDEINESSGNISKIIKVIDEIAFQTNILALNAAVEAARAGQHGKGFAVVAEEVRNLAARSANAAKETTALIEGSIKKAEAGTKIANETAQSLSKIVEGIGKAANLVAEIAAASSEQATAITQVNQAISQVAQVTQMNTATAEESASASEELSGQADTLKEMIGKFTLRRLDSSMKGMNGSNQDMMKLIEEVLERKSEKSRSNQMNETIKEAAITAEPRIKISLDDKEFGKY